MSPHERPNVVRARARRAAGPASAHDRPGREPGRARRRRHSTTGSPNRQRGAALLTALIIVTIVVTMSSAMVWQQWRAVQVEIGERARTQSAWILNGALDWAKLILRENQRSSAGVDHLGQPWAVPLAESRLSTFLAADKDATTDDGPEAFLSGAITDMQARLNLTDLVENGNVSPAEYGALTRLCESLGLGAEVATRIASGLLSATTQGVKTPTTPTAPPTTDNGGGGASTPPDPATPAVSVPEFPGPPPLLPKTVSQLAWFGIDAQTLATLRPHIAILPTATQVNVNTATREVLAAEFDVDLGTAERLIQYRQRSPFKAEADFVKQMPTKPTGLPRAPAFKSSFFEVRGRLRLNDRVLEQRSVLQRQTNGQVTVVETERISGFDEQPGT